MVKKVILVVEDNPDDTGVIVRASSAEQVLVASYRLGANSHVRKPVAFAEFAEAARQLGPLQAPPEHRAGARWRGR